MKPVYQYHVSPIPSKCHNQLQKTTQKQETVQEFQISTIPQPLRTPCLLTQATIINQSSAVLLLNIANLLMSLAATKRDASTKVVVVTTRTASPREFVAAIRIAIPMPVFEFAEGVYVMVVVESTYPSSSSPKPFNCPSPQHKTRIRMYVYVESLDSRAAYSFI
jgi:hypothetical protein